MSEPANSEVVILNAALELPVEQRAPYLDQVCAGDVVLRQQVEALLQAHMKAEGFLEASPARLNFKRTMLMDVLPTEKPGDKIGNYKLLQQIGEGGCGVVYMAEQEEPVRRRVALKVIKLGMDTKEVIARFEAERQALALMDHPNIAKVFDAGATRTGRPFFVMELVRGVKITEFCDENKVSTEERLKLFIRVCQAIQHAHQKGIIHRDIKPSNILVTVNDGVPVPKVIDFGIAKATAGRLTDKTLFTAFDQFIGTPAYMSPEQAVMTSLDIDTRSDIYSLGVLLYELLTGKTPFDANELFQVGFDVMRHIIREKEPPKPSTRLSTMLDAERTAAATRRQTDPPRLIHLVRGDLDWIVMKSLEKDRARRYETANGLAADIQRHLNNEPVKARPPSRLYLFKKSLQRNKLAFSAAAAIAFALAAGLGASTWLFLEARMEARKSRQVAQFLQNMLDSTQTLAIGRDTSLLEEMLDGAVTRIQRDLTNQPEVEVQLQNNIGNVYSFIGEPVKAENMARSAFALAQTSPTIGDTDAAQSLQLLGYALWRQGKSAEAEPPIREALTVQKRAFATNNLDVASSMQLLGLVLQNQGEASEAEHLFRQSLAIRRKLLGNGDVTVAFALNSLAGVLIVEGKLAEAENAAREALAAFKASGASDRSAAHILFNLANALYEKGKLAEAEGYFREVVTLQTKYLGTSHDNTAVAMSALGTALRRQGKFAEAEPLYRECLAIREKKVPDAWFTFYTRTLLGQTLVEQKKYADAEPLLLSGYEGMLQREVNIRDRSKVFPEALQYMVRLYEETNRPDLAAHWRQQLAEFKPAALSNSNNQ